MEKAETKNADFGAQLPLSEKESISRPSTPDAAGEGTAPVVSTPSAPSQDKAELKKVASVNDVAAIPNGGLRAWLQVLGSFFLFFNTW
jgi:hypothetical protein